MALNDDEPVRITRPQALDQMSLDELDARIAGLQAEILACETEIARKRAQKRAADALFGEGN